MKSSISTKDLKRLAKKKGVKKITSLTAAEYRELALGSQGRVENCNFSFSYHVEKEEWGYQITMRGVHLSKNVLNGGSFRKRLAYKKAIKQAVFDFLLINKKKLPFPIIEGKAEILFVFFNPSKRDYDNNYDTIKILQDSVSKRSKFGISILRDDDETNLSQSPNSPIQVISKEYKVEVFVYPVKERNTVFQKKVIQYV